MKIKCRPLDGVDLNGKILVMNPENLQPKYRTLKNMLYRATGGFGCHPTAIGRTIFTKEMFGPLGERWSRQDFEGWLTEEEFVVLCEENNLAWEVLGDGQVPDL